MSEVQGSEVLWVSPRIVYNSYRAQVQILARGRSIPLISPVHSPSLSGE
jgi:hypothetical protein